MWMQIEQDFLCPHCLSGGVVSEWVSVLKSCCPVPPRHFPHAWCLLLLYDMPVHTHTHINLWKRSIKAYSHQAHIYHHNFCCVMTLNGKQCVIINPFPTGCEHLQLSCNKAIFSLFALWIKTHWPTYIYKVYMVVCGTSISERGLKSHCGSQIWVLLLFICLGGVFNIINIILI